MPWSSLIRRASGQAAPALTCGDVTFDPRTSRVTPPRRETLPTPGAESTRRATVLSMNHEIASSSRLAEATVKVHVGRILTKLGLRDRAQVVVFAYENGVVHPGAG